MDERVTMKNSSQEQQYDITTAFIIDFVESATASERHQLVSGWNHDAGYEVFNWISNDPKTDKATALMMYWRSGGFHNKMYVSKDDMLKVASWDEERYDFIEQLEAKYLSGFYTKQKLAYDPTNDVLASGCSIGYNWTIEISKGELKREIPMEMLSKLDGEHIEPEKEWAEGIPPYVDKMIKEAYKNARPKLPK